MPASIDGHRAVNLAKHESQCSICGHPRREEIDREFLCWTSPTRVAKAFRLTRDAIYRHAHATGLFPKRQRNVRAALEKIIEKSSEVTVNAAAVVSAVTAYAKINAVGQWIERSDVVELNELFERMTQDELAAYARDGILPTWFPVSPQQEVKQSGP